ncbi:MAG TPA: IS66 family insertion sequence element accessory protein TnpB [Clostridiaceae bacterium]|nr:IS66 family insertion sequence element accessory protein TnpB [Clostridiaceae bacterium]
MELESISFSTTGDSLQELLSRVREDKAVLLAHHYVDMRKSINGLAGILQGEYGIDPFSGDSFLFCNRQKDKVKIIQWDSEGFILTYKRMERGKFHWPNLNESGTLTTIKRSDLKRLMKGLVMEQFVPRRNYVVV